MEQILPLASDAFHLTQDLRQVTFASGRRCKSRERHHRRRRYRRLRCFCLSAEASTSASEISNLLRRRVGRASNP